MWYKICTFEIFAFYKYIVPQKKKITEAHNFNHGNVNPNTTGAVTTNIRRVQTKAVITKNTFHRQRDVIGAY